VSEENVELFRRMIETSNVAHGDPSLLEPLLAADYRIENIVTAVTDKTYYGASGSVEWFSDMSEAFATGAEHEVEAIIADGEDFVVARTAFFGVGARSEAPLRLRWIAVTWFANGKATRSVGYAHRADALKAVGLEE
jgi:ketosteroid isomerase-like protein